MLLSSYAWNQDRPHCFGISLFLMNMGLREMELKKKATNYLPKQVSKLTWDDVGIAPFNNISYIYLYIYIFTFSISKSPHELHFLPDLSSAKITQYFIPTSFFYFWNKFIDLCMLCMFSPSIFKKMTFFSFSLSLFLLFFHLIQLSKLYLPFISDNTMLFVALIDTMNYQYL